MQATDTSSIQRLIAKARGRIRRQWALEGATLASIPAAAGALAVIYAMRVESLSTATGIALLAACGGIILIGAVISAVRKLDDETVARRIDRASNLSDRLSTAIAFTRSVQRDPAGDDETSDLMQAAIKDGIRAVPRADIVAAAPYTTPRDLRAAVAFLVVSALAAGLILPRPDVSPHLTYVDPSHGRPGETSKIVGEHLAHGTTDAAVLLGPLTAKPRTLPIVEWSDTAITFRVPEDAPIGDTVLYVKIGETTVGPLEYTVVDLKDARYHDANSVQLDPEERAYVERILAELKMVAKRDNVPELEEFAKKIEQMLDDAEKGKITKEQLLEALQKAEEALAKNAEPNQAEINKQMSELGKELAKNETTKQLGDALQKNDLEKAKQEMEKLANQLDPEEMKKEIQKLEKQLENKQLTPEEKKDLQKKLDDLKKQLDEMQKQKDQADKAEKDAEQAQKDAEQQQKDAEKKQAELDKQKKDLEKQMADLDKKLEDKNLTPEQKQDLQKKLDEMKKQMDKLQKQQQDAQKEQQDAQKDQKDAQQKQQDAEKQQDKLDKQKQDLEQQQEDLKKQLENKQLTPEQKQELQKKLDDLKQQKPLDEKQKQDLQKQMDKMSKQMDKQQKDQQKQDDQQQQKLQDEIKRLQKQQQEAKNDQERQQAERQLQKKKDELQKLQKDQQDKEDSAQRQALKRLQKDVEKAAENLDKPQKKDGQKDDRDAEEKERDRQAARNMKDAARETGRVDQDQRKQSAQKKMGSQMDDLREAMRRAKQKGQKGPQDPFNKGQKNQDFAQRSRGQKGSGQAWKPGQQPGQQPGGQNPGGQTNGQGGSEWGVGHDDNLAGDPTQKAGPTKDDDLQGVQGGKGQSRRQTILSAAQKGFASTSYQKVYADYQKIVEEVMRNEKMPSSYKYYVKRYFAKIHPSTAPQEEAKP